MELTYYSIYFIINSQIIIYNIQTWPNSFLLYRHVFPHKKIHYRLVTSQASALGPMKDLLLVPPIPVKPRPIIYLVQSQN